MSTRLNIAGVTTVVASILAGTAPGGSCLDSAVSTEENSESSSETEE